MNSIENKGEKAIQLLKEIVEWWDEWNTCAHPHELEDPPIEEARELVFELYKIG